MPWPNLVKIDVQGSELDILKGGMETLVHASDLIIELSHKPYNLDSPKYFDVIPFLQDRGFELVGDTMFCDNGVDGDYHFINTRQRQRGVVL